MGDYNDQYMVDTRSSKMADSVKKPRKPRVVDIDDENNLRGNCRRRKAEVEA